MAEDNSPGASQNVELDHDRMALRDTTQASNDTAATDFADRFCTELATKLLERTMLTGLTGPAGRRRGASGRPWVLAPASHTCAAPTAEAGRRVESYAGFCGPVGLAASRLTAIHLGPALPPASCGLPADSGEQPSNVRAGPPDGGPFLTLLRVGFT